MSIRQPIKWPRSLGLRKTIANHEVERATLGHEQFKSALAGRIGTLAYRLFAAQEKSAAAVKGADWFKALRDVLVQRDSAGLTPLLETRVIEAPNQTPRSRGPRLRST